MGDGATEVGLGREEESGKEEGRKDLEKVGTAGAGAGMGG